MTTTFPAKLQLLPIKRLDDVFSLASRCAISEDGDTVMTNSGNDATYLQSVSDFLGAYTLIDAPSTFFLAGKNISPEHDIYARLDYTPKIFASGAYANGAWGATPAGYSPVGCFRGNRQKLYTYNENSSAGIITGSAPPGGDTYSLINNVYSTSSVALYRDRRPWKFSRIDYGTQSIWYHDFPNQHAGSDSRFLYSFSEPGETCGMYRFDLSGVGGIHYDTYPASGTYSQSMLGYRAEKVTTIDTNGQASLFGDPFPATQYVSSASNCNFLTYKGIHCATYNYFNYVEKFSDVPDWLGKMMWTYGAISYNYGTAACNASIVNQTGYGDKSARFFIPTVLDDGRYACAYTWKSNTADAQYVTGQTTGGRGGNDFNIPDYFAQSFFCIGTGHSGYAIFGVSRPAIPRTGAFSYLLNVTFPNDPFLIWVHPNGFVLALIEDSQSRIWVAGAGVDFNISSGCNNFARYYPFTLS